MKLFFQAISYLLHPILMPMVGFFILFQAPTEPLSLIKLHSLYNFPEEVKGAMYLVMGILTVLAPGLSLLIMYWNKMISDLELSNRKERFYPYILIIFYFGLAFGFMKLKLHEAYQHPAMMAYVFGIIMVFVVAFFLNFYTKISMHAAGIFGVCGALLAYNQSQAESNMAFLIYLICLGGLVGSSRVYLKAHTLQETLGGMAVGFFVMFLAVKFHIYI